MREVINIVYLFAGVAVLIWAILIWLGTVDVPDSKIVATFAFLAFANTMLDAIKVN